MIQGLAGALSAARHVAMSAAVASALGAGFALAAQPAAAAPAQSGPGQGVIRAPSAYDFDETVARLKADIAAKGIRFFTEIDQGELASGAAIPLRPSKLLLFGNPPLGVQFLTSNPYAGLDWPVRVLVVQDADGKVWVAYSDFHWIADRYAIADREAAFKMASEVAASIAGSVGAP